MILKGLKWKRPIDRRSGLNPGARGGIDRAFRGDRRFWGPIMIRSLLRLLGVVILAAGFILVMYDGARSIADSRIYIYKLSQLWTDIHAGSLQSAQASVQGSLPSVVWDPVITTVLDQPAWLIFGIIGTGLILLGRKRKPLIGYAR
jgi:hypothetical protein